MPRRSRSVGATRAPALLTPSWRSRPGRLLVLLTAVALLAGTLSSSAWAARRAGEPAAGGPLAQPLVNKAPAVSKQPVSKTVEEGESWTFESTGSGTPTPTVQWERSTNGGSSWSPIAGATSDQLTIADPITAESGNEFRAVFTNIVGEATSKAATLTVNKAPTVTQQPVAQTVEEGQTATFYSEASGSPTPTVQWYRSTNGGGTWSLLSGATSDQLSVANAKTSESGHLYRATFKNAAGSVTTEAVALTVQELPAITRQPLSATVDEGEAASFEASASGFPTPSAQWEVSTNEGGSWSAIEGATSSKLTIATTSGSESGYEFRAVFRNAAGSATTGTATLTVHSPPVITQQPQGMTVEVGQPASFQTAATGFPTPTVQWEKSTDGGSSWSAVGGATSDVISIASTVATESGNEYRAVFTNTAASVTSAAATLTVATNHYSAVAWGQNLFRQLGDGNAEALSDVPVNVSGLKFVDAVAAGGRHSLALLADGDVVAWGDDEHGQLGDGEEGLAEVPMPVEDSVRGEGDRRRRQSQPRAAQQRHCDGMGRQRKRPAGRRWHRQQRNARRGQRSQRCEGDRGRRRAQPRAARKRHRDGLGRRRIGADRQRRRQGSRDLAGGRERPEQRHRDRRRR